MSRLDLAWKLVERGFAVFPCKNGEKVPACWQGVKEATKDVQQVRKFFEGKKLVNIGIATGEISQVVVIDDDTYKGGSLQELIEKFGPLPETFTIRTRAGGSHLYFKYPQGIDDLRCHNGVIHPHVDLRANGGYVLAEESFVGKDANGPEGYHVVEKDVPMAELPAGWVAEWEALSAKTKLRTKKNAKVA